MNQMKKERLIDEYEEATLKLFIEKYEASEGTLLWNEYQIAQRKNELPELPAALDIRCKELIRAHLLKEDRE